MVSSPSANLKLELMSTGEQSGLWGTTTNTNLGTLLEQAIVGYTQQIVADGVNTILTIPDYVSSNGRHYIIEFTSVGSLSANRTVEVPAVDKPYIFFNNTSGGYSVTVKVGGATGVTIANGKKAIVYCNSTDVISVVNAPVSEAEAQTITNKVIKPRVVNIATSASITVDADITDVIQQTNTEGTGTLTIAAPTGTFYDSQKFLFRLKSTNVQTFSWNAVFSSSTDTSLPIASSGAGKYDYMGFIYNSVNSKWQILAKNMGFAA